MKHIRYYLLSIIIGTAVLGFTTITEMMGDGPDDNPTSCHDVIYSLYPGSDIYVDPRDPSAFLAVDSLTVNYVILGRNYEPPKVVHQREFIKIN